MRSARSFAARAAFWRRNGGSTWLHGWPAPVGAYVGRDDELARFVRSFEDGAKAVVGISGEYGLGKSWLLRRFHDVAAERGALTALAARTEDGLPAMLGRLSASLEQRGAPLGVFDSRLRTYRRRVHDLQADPEAPKALAALAGGTVGRGGVRAARHLPGIGLAFELVSEDAAASAGAEVATWVQAKLASRDDAELVLEPARVLTQVFVAEARRVADTRPVVLCVDVDDASFDWFEEWAAAVVRNEYGELPVRLLLVLASARELTWRLWADVESRVDRMPLGPLDEADARRYLEHAGVTNEAVVAEILRKSRRVPLALAILAKQRPETPEQVGDPSTNVVDGFLVSVEDPARRRLAVDASVARIVNRDVLAVVLGADDPLEEFAWLTGLPFVRAADAGWVYSDQVREQLVRRSRRDAPQTWSRLHARLAEFYERLAGDLGLGEDECTDDPEWQRYDVEAVYHLLCCGHQTRLPRALNGLMAAFSVSRRLAQRYADAIRQAGLDTGVDALADLGERLVAGLDALEAGTAQQAAPMFEALLATGKLSPRWRAKALDWRGYLAAGDGDYDRALGDYAAAIELDPDSVEYRLDRAVALQRLGRYEEVFVDLDHAVSVEPDSVPVLMTRAATLQLAERFEEALGDVARVLELEPQNPQAWVLRADLLQLVGRPAEAIEALDRALELDPDDARALAARARVQQAGGDVRAAIADLERAVELAGDDYGIRSQLANALAVAGESERAREEIGTLVAQTREFVETEGVALVGLPADELERRARLWARMSGLDEREAERQIALFASGPETVLRVLEADAAAVEAERRTRENDGEGALTCYDRALELDPRRGALWRARGALKILLGRHDEAAADIEQALELVPEDPEAWATRARLRMVRGDLTAALADIERAVELAPGKYRFVSMRLVIEQALGDLDGAVESARLVAAHAEEFLTELLVARPALVEASALLDSRTRGATDVLRNLLELAARDRDEAVRTVRADALTVEAGAAGQRGDFDAAAELFTQALDLVGPRAPWLAQRAEAHRLRGRYDDALADLDRALELDPALATAHWTRGQVLRALRRSDEALAALDRAVELDPASAGAYFDRAELNRLSGRLDAALSDFDRVLELQPDSPAALGSRGQTLRALGRTEEALAALHRALELDGTLVWARLERAELHRAAGGFDAALADLDEAERLQPGSPIVAAGRSQVLFEAGRVDEALAVRDRMVEAAPDDADAWAGRAQFRLAAGRPDEALADADRAVALAPAAYRFVSLRFAILQAKGDLVAAGDAAAVIADHAEELVAEVAARGGAAPAGGDVLGTLFGTAPGDTEAAVRAVRADALRARAVGLVAGGELEAALDAFERSFELVDPGTDGLVQLAEVYRMLRRYDEALAVLDRAGASADSDAVVHGLRGRTLAAFGREDEALAALDRAVELDPTLASVYLDRGELHRLAGRLDQALADFERLLELAPDSAVGVGSRGQVLRALGRDEEALADLDRALALDSGLAWALIERAELRLEAGLYAEALADFSRAAETDQELRALVGSGQALAALGRYEEALADLERALELEPENAPALASRGLTRHMLDDDAGALDDVTHAVATAPGWLWALGLHAELLELAGRHREALAALEPVLADEPENDWCLYLRALARNTLGDAEAAADLDRAIATADARAAEEGGAAAHRLNAALYRLARGRPGDVEEARQIYADTAAAPLADRRMAVRDLTTLARVQGSDAAAALAEELAAAAR